MKMRYVLTRNDELYHYGVKGMKWGVRKDRNSTNSISSYSDKFPTQKPLVYRQKDREHLKKLFNSGEDFVLSKNNHVYRATNSSYEKRGRRYVTALLNDARNYAEEMDYIGGTYEKPVYVNEYGLKKDIKVAGTRVQYKELLKLYGLKDEANKITKNTTTDELWDMNHYMYERTKQFVDIDVLMKDTPMRTKFVNAMSKKGYDACVDMTDSYPLGVGFMDTPMIMLDSKDSIRKIKSAKIYDPVSGWEGM